MSNSRLLNNIRYKLHLKLHNSPPRNLNLPLTKEDINNLSDYELNQLKHGNCTKVNFSTFVSQVLNIYSWVQLQHAEPRLEINLASRQRGEALHRRSEKV